MDKCLLHNAHLFNITTGYGYNNILINKAEVWKVLVRFQHTVLYLIHVNNGLLHNLKWFYDMFN